MAHAELQQDQGEQVLAVEQLGAIGKPSLSRSEGRAYWTMAEVIHSSEELIHNWNRMLNASPRVGRRRVVVRAIVTPAVEAEVRRQNLPVEVSIPMGENVFLVLGHNVHTSTVPEWESVAHDWLDSEPVRTTPSERLARLPAHFAMEVRPNSNDVEGLLTLWQPFGWTAETLAGYIQNQQRDRFGFWFSGIRDTRTGRLVSACMGQGAQMADQYIIEATEFGTHPDYLGQGLCTAALIGLNAQMVRDALARLGRNPFIFSECSLSSRSDMVARNALNTIPRLTAAQRHTPTQVLRRNVSVLDGNPPNDLEWNTEGLPERYQATFQETDYQFWRNFVMTTLSDEAIATGYSESERAAILSHYQRTTR